MIEIFKTNVQETEVSAAIIQQLLEQLPDARINFDLDDCDKILKIDSNFIDNKRVVALLLSAGYQCEALPDAQIHQ